MYLLDTPLSHGETAKKLNISQVIKEIPSESSIHNMIEAMSVTETPVSYRLICALSLASCNIGRRAFFNISSSHIYPNLSYFLIGPSGIGKDTTIERYHIRGIKELNERFQNNVPLRIVMGQTWERLADVLAKMVPPVRAACPIPEASRFFGRREYQQTAMTGITDVLSENDEVDITLKSDKGTRRVIRQPTLTVMLGSTQAWCHSQITEGAMQGGFIPRFIVVPEEYATIRIPIPSLELPPSAMAAADSSWVTYIDKTLSFLERLGTRSKPVEVAMLPEAYEDIYRNWYLNREKYFSNLSREYAYRARALVLKLFMAFAFSRGRTIIDSQDVISGTKFMEYIGERLDRVVVGTTSEGRCRKKIMDLLPATGVDIYKIMLNEFDRRIIDSAIGGLLISRVIRKADSDLYKMIGDDA